MKKLLLILFTLNCFFASAQKIQYVNTYGYQYQRIVADTLLGLPKDTFAVPTALRTTPFLTTKSGTLYKWNTVTFAWDAFTGGGSTETASEGLIKSGDDIRFGGPIGSPGVFTAERTVNVNRLIMHWTNGVASEAGGALWQFSNRPYSPFQFISRDTVTSTGQVLSLNRPLTGIYGDRTVYFNSGVYRADEKLYGHRLGLRYSFQDSMTAYTAGGDYYQALIGELRVVPRNNGYSAFRTGHGTGTNLRREEGVAAIVANMYLDGKDDASTDTLKVNGTVVGIAPYLIAALGSGKIRVDNVVYMQPNGLINTNSYIAKSYILAPAVKYNVAGVVDSAFGYFDTTRVVRSYHAGNMVVGPAVSGWSSTDNFKVFGNTNITDSLTLGKATNIADTTGYDILTRNRSNGGVFRMTSTQLNTFLSGGGGANAALSNLSGVAINTSLVSDANNTDDLGSSANAWKDGYAYRYIAKGSTSGTIEYKSDALGNTPNITTLSGTGYGVSWMETRETSDFTGSNINTVQPVFNTSGDVFTLQGSTSYDFEGVYSFNHGAASHSVGLSFELGGGASVTSITYITMCWVTAIGTNTASQTTNLIQTTANTAVNAAGLNATEQIYFKGTINMAAGGTVTPSYTFSAAPGGTVLTKAGSYIKFTPKGTNTFTTIGNVN